jgi:hypothetical protein
VVLEPEVIEPPAPLPLLSPIERRSIDHSGFDAAVAFADEAMRNMRRSFASLERRPPLPGVEPSASVTRIAIAMGLHVERGAYWTTASCSAMPPWLVTINAGSDAVKQAVYVSKARAVAHEVAAINLAGGRVSPSAEARLLGYPQCCVTSHHDEVAKVDRLFALLLERVGAGDEVRMRRLVADDGAMAPETEEELKLAQSFAAPRQIPFTSINACAPCAADPGSPARKVAARYRALAETVDPDFARRIEMAGFGCAFRSIVITDSV